jgi:hypothetical protein
MRSHGHDLDVQYDSGLECQRWDDEEAAPIGRPNIHGPKQLMDEVTKIVQSPRTSNWPAGVATMTRKVYFYRKEDSSRVEGHPLLIAQKREEVEEDAEPLPVALHEMVAQQIKRARQLIADPTSWFRLGHKAHGQHCIETALSQVSLDRMLLPLETHGLAITCINTAVRRLYPCYHPHFTCRPAAFNDLASTTHDDVMLVMSVAAEIAHREFGVLPIPTPDSEGAEFGGTANLTEGNG